MNNKTILWDVLLLLLYMQFLPQCVCECHWWYSCAHMLCVYASVRLPLRVSLHPVGLSVWFRGVDRGWPSGQRFIPSCWKDRPEHRLKLGLKLSDWQRSERKRSLEICHRVSAWLCPCSAHTYARASLSCHTVRLHVPIERQRERKIAAVPMSVGWNLRRRLCWIF